MIDFTVPDELGLTINGLLAFMRAEVEPLEAEHRDLLDTPQACYDATGRLVPRVRDLSRQVGMAAARAGYYPLFTPVDVGCGGQGPLALFHVWEALYQKAGAWRMLPYEAVSHWAT